MTLKTATAALIILAGTGLWGQSAEPAPAAAPASAPAAAPTPIPMQPQGLTPRRMSPMGPGARATNLQNVTPRQRLQDLQETVASMHVLLKQMRAKAPAKDSLAKQNLDMWDLLMKHLDKQLLDLRVATAAHEDMESRRAALYKQADERSAAAAQAARAANAAKMAAAAEGSGSSAAPAAAPATAPGTAAPANNAPAAGSTSSPN
ncbi:MAG TPA: hypothetical protein VKV39_08170 [Candidatus Sulfotelmatobacter sp.]|nr:hypothetical protein [Candidatus Sulfotelmatobacter sp.]